MSTLAPFFYVRLNGDRLPDDLARRIIPPLEITEEDGKLTRITMRLQNDDGGITDDDRISLGAKIEVLWGYLGQKRTAKVTGTVEKISGFRVRTVSAYAEAHEMALEARSRVWEQVTYSDIATEIAGMWGLRADVERTDAVHEQVVQVNETDFHFLSRLAQEVGFEFRVEGDVLRFRPREYGAEPVMALHYHDGKRGNLMDFDPTEETLDQPGAVQVAGVNPMTKEPIEVRGSNETTEREAAGPARGVFEFSGETGRMVAYSPAKPEAVQRVAEPVHTVEEAQEKADAQFRQAEETVITARFKAVGDVRLRCGVIVTLYGVGKRYGGNWRVTRVIHALGSGYVVTGDLARNATPMGQVETKAEVNTARAEPEPETPEQAAEIRRPVYEYSGETGQQVGVIP